MGRLTFSEVIFIAFAVTLLNGNGEFMADMRRHEIEWFIRYPVSMVSWAVSMAIAAVLWRMLFGKGRWLAPSPPEKADD